METIMIELTPVLAVAFEVLAGKYGTGEERAKKLRAAGYDADLIQSAVNDLVRIRDKYGE